MGQSVTMPGPNAQAKRLRVAVVTRALPTYRFPLYLELLCRDVFDFHIFCENVDVNDPAKEAPAPPPELPLTLASYTSLRRWFWQKGGWPLPAFSLVRAIQKYRPDMVIMEGLGNLGTDLACLPYLLRKKIPFAWWTLGEIPATRHLLRARLGRLVQRWFARHAHAIIAYSSYAVRVMTQMGAVPRRIVNVKNTIDEQAVLRDIERCRARAEELRKELNPDNAPVAVFCGSVHAGKRLDLLLQAWAALPTMNPPPVLLIIGDGPALSDATTEAKRLGIADRVRFVGRQKEFVSAYLLLGQVFILPGLGGLGINHAFAHRLPVICGQADGCEEDLVHTGETGVRLHDVTPSTLAEAIRSLLSQPAEAARMGENAFRKITEEITLANFTDNILRSVQIATGQKVGEE